MADEGNNAEQIIIIWRTIDRIIHAKYHELAQQYDLTIEQFHLLLQLEEINLAVNAENPTIGQIADAAGNAPHTLTDRIKRLEKKGLVEKKRDPVDQRICRITITAAGQELVTRIVTAAGGDFIRNTLCRMSGEELSGLHAALTVFQDRLAEESGMDATKLSGLHALVGLKRH